MQSSGICLLLWTYIVLGSDAVGHAIKEIQEYVHAAKDETHKG